MDQVKIGKLIAECRKAKKLTQVELAEKLGVTDKSVSKWENGNCLPDVSLYKKICEIIEKLDDINIFDICEYTPKELDKLLDGFYNKDDIYYYKDNECTQKVKGLIRSKKKLNVKGGVLIKEQPYAITDKIFIFAR